MLDFSRERPPKFTVVNVNELIEKTIGLLNHQLHSLNIETRMNLASYLPTVEGDASQIQQILFNLITTARQAMEASDVKDKTLHIGTDTAFLPTDIFSRPHIVITISDNGRGVPQHALPNVYNPFTRLTKKAERALELS